MPIPFAAPLLDKMLAAWRTRSIWRYCGRAWMCGTMAAMSCGLTLLRGSDSYSSITRLREDDALTTQGHQPLALKRV